MEAFAYYPMVGKYPHHLVNMRLKVGLESWKLAVWRGLGAIQDR